MHISNDCLSSVSKCLYWILDIIILSSDLEHIDSLSISVSNNALIFDWLMLIVLSLNWSIFVFLCSDDSLSIAGGDGKDWEKTTGL